MNSIATTTVTVLRGTGTDEFGDPADIDTPVESGVIAAISERRLTSQIPSSLEDRTVHYYVCRVTSGTDIRKGDRLQDEQTNEVFIVTSVNQPRSAWFTPDLMLELQQEKN